MKEYNTKIIQMMKDLQTDKDRLEVLSSFCMYCGNLNSNCQLKICSETEEECEYEPAELEPCFQCRIYRKIKKDE